MSGLLLGFFWVLQCVLYACMYKNIGLMFDQANLPMQTDGYTAAR
jgi:hypothetical protein